MIRDALWPYFIYIFQKDNICCCVFKSRSDVVAENFADFHHSVPTVVVLICFGC